MGTLLGLLTFLREHDQSFKRLTRPLGPDMYLTVAMIIKQTPNIASDRQKTNLYPREGTLNFST